ncbi:MAG: immunoglobulin domain-containing protein [bacterium]
MNAIGVLPGGDVIVGGSFSTAGGLAASNIARYRPSTGTWTALGSGTDDWVSSIAVLSNGDVIVGGQFAIAGGLPTNRIARYNLTTNTWTALGSGINGEFFSEVRSLVTLPGGDVIVGGDFSTAGGVAANNIARLNPATGVWTTLGTGTEGPVRTMSVLPSGDILVAGNFCTAGGVTTCEIARLNPTTGAWSAVGSGSNPTVSALAVLPDGNVVVGGRFSTAGAGTRTSIALFNPTSGTWSTLGSIPDNSLQPSSVTSLAILPDGDVIVGGAFANAGNLAARNIARCRPMTGDWSVLGVGLNGLVLAFAALPSGDVLVGGDFDTAGGVAANNIVRYSPASGIWSALGAGISGQVNAISVLPGGDVIIGGNFNTAGGLAANNIVRYSPPTGAWSALGSGTNNVVATLATLPSGDVIAGGFFTTAGGVSASGVARYTQATGTWSPLGAGLGDAAGVVALAVIPGGDVIVGGEFSSAGGVAASDVARYNPATGTGSALGAGLGDAADVFALAVLPDGDVIVGGQWFDAIGGTAENIARYNPTTGIWSSLRSGIGRDFRDAVYALAVLPGGDVIVGGYFTSAGGGAANNIIRCNPTINAWLPLGTGVSGIGAAKEVYAVAGLPDGGVLAGGRFTLAGENPSAYFARYTLGGPPSLVVQPVNLTRCVGTTATLSVTASGAPPLTFQWRRNGVNIPGATSATLAFGSVGPGNGGSYQCVITNGCGSATSTAATLTVNTPLAITVQPVSLTRCAGAAATLSVTATGTAPLTYQWRKNGVNIPGATAATRTIASPVAADAGTYDCVITNGCGSVTSNPVTLAVNTPVTITTQPVSLTRCSGTAASFSVANTGSGTITYQWRRNGTNIPGATASTYTINSVTAANAGVYTVVVTGICGPVTSAAATLTIGTPTTAIVASPADTEVCIGSVAVLTVTATGPSPLTYRWRLNGVTLNDGPAPVGGVISGASTSQLRLTVGSFLYSGFYSCTVTGPCGDSVTSFDAQLVVNGCSLLIGPCSPADVAGGGQDGRMPDGVLDGNDVTAFMNSFSIGDAVVDPLADIAGGDTGNAVDPDGVIDGADLIAFVNAFAAGC